MAKPQDESVKRFKEYLSDKKVVVADACGASRAGIAKLIISMGAQTKNIIMAGSYSAAHDEIVTNKPHVVICDYDLDGRCGLGLLQDLREQRPESKDCLFILVTGTTSQSAVAQAAEEDVDMFILKPYTLGVFRNSVMKAALTKIRPSQYRQTIDKGKDALAAGEHDEAMKIFTSATEMDTKPSLACFYMGQTELLKDLMDEAKLNYDTGLQFNKIHYKCLVGLFDLYMSKKKYEEAYGVVKRIARYFPANPQRLASVLRLAVMTKSYPDIENYYQTFVNLDYRNDELIRYVCAAMVVTGKYYLRSNNRSRALELFQKVTATAAGRVKILREIVSALAEFKLVKEASQVLGRFPPESHTDSDFIAMKLLIDDFDEQAGATIDRARQALQNNHHDPVIYEILIRRCFENELNDAAENYIIDASSRWPERTKAFKALAGDQK